MVAMDRPIALLIIVLAVGMFALWGVRTILSESANRPAARDRRIVRSMPVRRLDPMLGLFGVSLLVAVIVYLVRGAA
jgi:hypothetical protein